MQDLQVFPHILGSNLQSRCCDPKLDWTITAQSLIKAFAWIENALVSVFRSLPGAG